MLGCLNASIMLRKGDGIPKDEKLSDFYRTKANQIREENDSMKQHVNITFGKFQIYFILFIKSNFYFHFQ